MNIQSFNQFGLPVLKRIEEIEKKVQHPDSSYPLPISGKSKTLPVISVGIDFPSYRLNNGRTKTAQLEYIATHPDADPNLFRDQESFDAQSAQHEVLKTLVNEEDLLSSFKKEQEQTLPIICTRTGVVVNGNRRLCAWRILYYADSVKYKKFERISIAILPELNEKEISSLEKELQIQKTMKASYHWHAEALMAEDELKESGRSEQSVAKSYNLSPQKLHALIGAKQFAQQYLETIAKPNVWSLVDNSRYAFEQIYEGYRKITDVDSKELFVQVAFDLVSKGEELDDRLYATIKSYAGNMPIITKVLVDNLPERFKATEGKHVDGSITALAGTSTLAVSDAVVVSEAIDHGYVIPQANIKAALEAHKAATNEKNRSKYLIDQLSKVSSALQSIIMTGITSNTKTDGAEEQINSIEEKLSIIRSWISKK